MVGFLSTMVEAGLPAPVGFLYFRRCQSLATKLNRDLDRYPPPRRNPKDEMPLRQTWSGYSFARC